MISWDDYKLVLTVARAEGLQSAAKTLDVTLSTVFRRLEKIEKTLEVRLFERQKGHYAPTDAGQELVLVAERMEQEALAGDRAISGRDQQLTGTVRITSTESIATCFLARHISSFQNLYPGLMVEVIADNRRLSLADREADIALRPRRQKEEGLVGRLIGSLGWGIYGSPNAIDNLPADFTLDILKAYPFIAWEGSPAALETMAWLNETLGPLTIPYRSTSILTNAAMAAAGDALVPLPCTVGSIWPGLCPVHVPLAGAIGELWCVTHEDLRRNAKVRVLMDHLADAAKKDAALLQGNSA